MESTQKWIREHKLVLFLFICVFCLSISTLILALERPGSKLMDTNEEIKSIEDYQLSRIAENKDINYRLPRHIRPENYKLILQPDLDNKFLKAIVIISLKIWFPTRIIVLHSQNLTIDSAKVTNKQGENFQVTRIENTYDCREFLYVKMGSELRLGMYDLEIRYSGNLNRGLVGIYASTLKNGNTMLASKFQPTYARQGFPCFDEPDFKATFDITLVKPANLVALSNMNVISKISHESNNIESVTYARSVPMSPYLACFVICDFNFIEHEVNAHGIGKNFILRSYAQKDEMRKIEFAQDIGRRATEFYIKYYDVPFPLPKLDMIAIPDYISGATEHWGLVTYRGTKFLIDPMESSSENKISVAGTIAHELAHMWFGNLVTNKWWDDLWLNEGFASYMQVKALNAIEPSWTMLDQFLTDTLHSVLVIDAKLSSHPIVQVVSTPDEITSIFDTITYSKGSSILRMLEDLTGAENFRRGVSDYLKKFEFDNTVTTDLLACLEPYFKKNNPSLNINYIMDTWTRQMGYPLLEVSKGLNENIYTIRQHRFLMDPNVKYKMDSEFNYRWFVPITYKTNKGVNKDILWFPDTANSVTLALKDDETWLKINNNQMGYYRVTYPLSIWETLTSQLKSKSDKLTLSDRAHLLNDVFALAEAGWVSYALALELTTYLTVEEDFVPWSTASSIFATLDAKLTGTLAQGDLQKFFQSLVKPLYKKQSWEANTGGIIEGLVRTKILSLATRAGLPDAEARARDAFQRWLAAPAARLEADLRGLVYYYGMKHASMSEWEQLWQVYLKTNDVQELAKLRQALAGPRDTEVLGRYLALAWDEANVRAQDYLEVLALISKNPSGTALVWDHVRAHWPQLVTRYSLNNRYLGNMIPSITGTFNTDVKLKEMESFFAQYPEAGAGAAARARALETARSNAHWADQHLGPVSEWLRKQAEKGEKVLQTTTLDGICISLHDEGLL